MGYKEEKNRHIEQILAKNTATAPQFIKVFLMSVDSPVTKRNYWCVLREMLEYFIDSHVIIKKNTAEIQPEDLSVIHKSDVIVYFNYLKIEKGNSDSTLRTKKQVIGSFWNYLIDTDICTKNIIFQIGQYTKKEKPKVKIPTEEQYMNFLENIRKGNNNEFDCFRNLTIVQLFKGSAVRSEELIGLDVSDLSLEAEEPYIMVMRKGEYKEQSPVYISPDAGRYLKEYLQYRKMFVFEKMKDGKVVNNTALFLSNRGKRLCKSSIDGFFKRYSNNTITPHMLRHYAATLMRDSGVSIDDIADVLGHRSVETTRLHYIQESPQRLSKAVAVL